MHLGLQAPLNVLAMPQIQWIAWATANKHMVHGLWKKKKCFCGGGKTKQNTTTDSKRSGWRGTTLVKGMIHEVLSGCQMFSIRAHCLKFKSSFKEVAEEVLKGTALCSLSWKTVSACKLRCNFAFWPDTPCGALLKLRLFFLMVTQRQEENIVFSQAKESLLVASVK